MFSDEEFLLLFGLLDFGLVLKLLWKMLEDAILSSTTFTGLPEETIDILESKNYILTIFSISIFN